MPWPKDLPLRDPRSPSERPLAALPPEAKKLLLKVCETKPHVFREAPASYGSGCWQTVWFYDPDTLNGHGEPVEAKCCLNRDDPIHVPAELGAPSLDDVEAVSRNAKELKERP